MHTYVIVPVLKVLILCQDITTEVPDSSCQLAKIHIPIPLTTDNSDSSHKIFQEAITLDFEEIIENRVTMETIDNTQSTTFNVNKSNICTVGLVHVSYGYSYYIYGFHIV